MKKISLFMTFFLCSFIFLNNTFAQTNDDYFTYQEVVRLGNTTELNDLFRISSEDVNITASAQEGTVNLTIKNVSKRTLYIFPPSLKSVDNSNPERVDLVISFIPAPSTEPIIINSGETVTKSLSVGQVTMGVSLKVSVFVPQSLGITNGQLAALEEKNILTVQ